MAINSFMIKRSMFWSTNRDYITILVFAIWYRKGGLKYVSNNPISICTPRIHTMRCFGHLLCFQYHSVATHEKKNLSSGGRTKTMVLNSYLSSFELPVCLTQLLRESIKSANIVRLKKMYVQGMKCIHYDSLYTMNNHWVFFLIKS